MSPFVPLIRAADPAAEMPPHAGARLDAANAALAGLREEQRRLLRLGLETPLARCHHQLRFWSFVSAVCSLEPGERA